MAAGFKGNCLELRGQGVTWFSLAFDDPNQVKLNDEKVTVVDANNPTIKWTGSAKKRFNKTVRFKVSKSATVLPADVSPDRSRLLGPGDLITVNITITLTDEQEMIVELPAVVDAPTPQDA